MLLHWHSLAELQQSLVAAAPGASTVPRASCSANAIKNSLATTRNHAHRRDSQEGVTTATTSASQALMAQCSFSSADCIRGGSLGSPLCISRRSGSSHGFKTGFS